MSDHEEANIIIAAPLGLGNSEPESSSGRVSFNIKSLDARSPKSALWLATFSTGSCIATFQIELDDPYDKDETAIPPLEFGEGKLLAVDGSDGSLLVAALAEALEAKAIPANPSHVAALPFVYTSFGSRLSSAPGGGFQTNPAGEWKVMKLFLGENTEEDEGQVFLALNPTTTEGQFVIKDADYGDIVLRHLATIL